MWKYDPFEATKDAEGNIHARGAVDMKCVGAMYLEAIRRLKKKGFTPLRNIHVSFVPDEEVGGFKGMGAFSVSPQFRRLNVGFALDEGLGSEDDFFNIYYGERAVCQFRVTARGTGGSPVDMLEDCAAEKLHFVISRLMDLRRDQNNLWHSRPDVDLGDITSLNLTMLAGGTDPGIIPDELSAVFDMRVTPQWRMEDVIQFLYDICLQAGPGVTYTLGQHSAVTAATPTSDDNIWWRNFKAAADYLEIKLRARVFPVATDVRFIRESGIPSFGFSPMSNMPLNTDPHDEFINESTFLKGIKIYEVILQRIANVTKSDTTP